MDGRADARPLTSTTLLQNAVYGDDALEAYFEENEGNLVQSPKSMLGYNLHPRARQTIAGIATHILEHIRLTAVAQLDTPMRTRHAGPPGAVPQFDRRGRQRAGAGDPARRGDRGRLRQMDFLEEPAAAAMHYHAESASEHEAVWWISAAVPPMSRMRA